MRKEIEILDIPILLYYPVTYLYINRGKTYINFPKNMSSETKIA